MKPSRRDPLGPTPASGHQRPSAGDADDAESADRVDARACLRAARRCDVAALRHLMQAGRLVLAVNALVHALQRERGASSLWLAREDTRAGQRLSEYRAAVDGARAALERRLAERLETRGCGARLYARFALALERLDELPGLREPVDARTLAIELVAGAFTRMIHALLDVVFEAADAATDPPVARTLVALFHFVLGKEQAGQERAIGAAAFGRRGLSQRERDALLQRIDAQERCFQVFGEFAEDELQGRWNVLLVAAHVAEVERLRRILLSSIPGQGGVLPDLAESWFAQTTERIDAMKQVEDALEAALESICAHRLTQVEAELESLNAEVEGGAAPLVVTDEPGRRPLAVSDAWLDLDDVRLQASALPVGLGTDAGRSILDVLHDQSVELRKIRHELSEAQRALEERKTLGRAKALLMKHRGLTEDEAHQLLRRTAMAQNRRLVDVAAAAIDLADVLAGSGSGRDDRRGS